MSLLLLCLAVLADASLYFDQTDSAVPNYQRRQSSNGYTEGSSAELTIKPPAAHIEQGSMDDMSAEQKHVRWQLPTADSGLDEFDRSYSTTAYTFTVSNTLPLPFRITHIDYRVGDTVKANAAVIRGFGPRRKESVKMPCDGSIRRSTSTRTCWCTRASGSLTTSPTRTNKQRRCDCCCSSVLA